MPDIVWLLGPIVRLSKEALASSTFWTAVGSIGAVGALIFAGRQLFLTRKIEAYKLLCEGEKKFLTEDFVAERSALARVLLREPLNFDLVNAHVHDVLGFYEDMGLMLRKGIAPLELVWSTSSHYILRYWPAVKWFIDEDRRRCGDKNYYNDFEYLHQRVSKYEARKLGHSYQFTDSERRVFLEGEVAVEIRLVLEEDLVTLEEIESRSFTTDGFDYDDFKKAYEEQRTWFFVASVLGEPVGYVLGSVSEDGVAGELESLAVQPEYTRCGIGRRLLEHFLSRLRCEHVEMCELQVDTKSTGAVRMYERSGFQRRETIGGYYTDGSDAFVMKKRL